MKKYNLKVLQNWFEALAVEENYQVLAPVALRDGTRSLGELSPRGVDDDAEQRLQLAGGALPMKPARVFTPYFDLEFSFSSDGKIVHKQSELPLLVVGFTAQDLDCLEFVDKFFSTNYYDEHYFAKRKGAVVIGVSGKCGKNGELLKIAGGKCDIELIGLDADNEKHYVVVAYSELGNKLIAKLNELNANGDDDVDAQDAAALEEMQSASRNIDKEDWQLLQKASALLLANKVPDEFWQDIADRCISCTACTFCPTCTCFDVFDRRVATKGQKWGEQAKQQDTQGEYGEQSERSEHGERTERWRIFDSCLLSSFMREASGHNPMSKESLRTRRRIHHRLAADVVRWGHITCYLCGRCDALCPSDIGIKSVCREMLERYGKI